MLSTQSQMMGNQIMVKAQEQNYIIKQQEKFQSEKFGNKIQKICKNMHKKVITSKKSEEVRTDIKIKKVRHIRWSRQQDLIYLNFLKQNKECFKNQFVRRSNHVFYQLSKKMGGVRTSIQCKSHHQKMQKATKNVSIQRVISYLEHKCSSNMEKYPYPSNIKTSVNKQQKQPAYKIDYKNFSNYKEAIIQINLDFVKQW